MTITRNNSGYSMSLGRSETYRWAHKPRAAWPCSELADRSVYVEVDSNGLCDVRPSDISGGAELEAIIADHLPADLRKYWPTWGK
jgi:hypothetical protein